MKLSISNIGFDLQDEESILEILKKNNFDGLEIAPTMFIGENPYEHSEIALKKARELKEKYNVVISSMQSILHGQKENIFNLEEQKQLLIYMKKAIDFAQIINCKNLVFGCPKNRNMKREQKKDDIVSFFKELGDYAFYHKTTLAIEPNPILYGTNFINYTKEAFEFVKTIHSKGLKVNVDFGTIIENEESLELIKNNINCVNHVHISEPNLIKIKKRIEHKELALILKESNYEEFVSIEMKKTENINDLIETINYIKNIFK